MVERHLPGKLVVLSGPSGVGKTTVLDGVLARYKGRLRLAVSATTRRPRPGETEGEDYYFLSNKDFDRRRQNGEFIECCEVFGHGHWYGTLHSEVGPSLTDGLWVMLEIDVDGTRQVLRHYPEAETIFLLPGSIAELERRLRSRGTETEEAVERRLSVAQRELDQADTYRHQVVNDRIENAVDQICTILTEQGINQ